MPGKRLQEFLDKKHVKYVTINHSLAYTALEVSEAAHIPGKIMAKSLMIFKDNQLVMVVLPANKKIDLDAFNVAVKASTSRFATEQEFKNKFPDCDIGAMPPFGNLYNIEVYVDNNVARQDEIAFNAGSHYQLFKMNYSDYEKLVHPHHIEITI